MLKQVLNHKWLQIISDGMHLNKKQPTSKGIYYTHDEQTGQSFFHDALTIPHNPFYEKYITESPIGSIAAQIMCLPSALAFYTTVFFRTGGTKERTPWHQDQTYWSADSKHGLSIWTCLEPVPKGTGLETIYGSHLWRSPLDRPWFEELNMGGTMDINLENSIPIPDFSNKDKEKYKIMEWVMNPGDILVFNGMTVHGGSGNLPRDLARHSISVQWLGSDAVITERPGGNNPDWLPEFAELGLAPGDYPGCEICPEISIP